jgi:ubiquitin-conjugating enzyme E2 O
MRKDPTFEVPILPPGSDISTDRIIDVQPVIVYVVWNAINQQVSPRVACQVLVIEHESQLPISEQPQHPEPPRFWYGPKLEDLTHISGIQNRPASLGDTVRFIDRTDDRSEFPRSR